MVDLHPGQRRVGDPGVDLGIAGRLGEIADPAQQPPGDARRPPRAARHLPGAVLGEREAEQPRGAADDLLQLRDRIEGEPHRNAEAVAQRRRDQPLPRGRADQGEFGQVDPDRARRRPLADHQVEHAVLHRRIEDLLDRRREPVDLVDEQDVAILEIGEQGGEIARLGDHRPGGGAEADAELARDDLRQRRLAEPRRPEEQDMVERVAAALGGLDEHAQILPRRLLPDELVERLRAQRRVEVLGPALGRGDAVGVGHCVPAALSSTTAPATASRSRLWPGEHRACADGQRLHSSKAMPSSSAREVRTWPCEPPARPAQPMTTG